MESWTQGLESKFEERKTGSVSWFHADVILENKKKFVGIGEE
jgi:hypothetical protein